MAICEASIFQPVGYINNVQSIGYNYSVVTDKNNPTRVFAGYLEFTRDYSKPLSPTNGSWTFVKNWSAKALSAWDNVTPRLRSCVTLSNGRTYAFAHSTSNVAQLIELVNNFGLRYTGVMMPTTNCRIQPDGSLLSNTDGGGTGTSTFNTQTITGFDGNNNPVWSTKVLIGSVATSNTDPISGGGLSNTTGITSSGLIISHSSDKQFTSYGFIRGAGFHLGAIPVYGTSWLWRTSPSTFVNYTGPFPTDGAYDIGNNVNYTSGYLGVVDRNIFWNYKGENWKSNQVNKINHYLDNGLMVGQFGVLGTEGTFQNAEASAMMAGNNNSGSYSKIGNDIYYHHADEGYHGGVHEWKISNLASIKELSYSSARTTFIVTPARSYTNLMDGLPVRDTLRNSTAGWTISPATSYSITNSNRWTPLVGKYTYAKGENDVFLTSFPNGTGQTYSASRSLHTSTVNNWTLTGQIAYPIANEPGENALEILDASGKVLVKIYKSEVNPNSALYANTTSSVIALKVTRQFFSETYLPIPFSISGSGTTITIKVGNYSAITVSKADASANMTTPKIVRARFFSSNNASHSIVLANLKWYSN